MIREINLDEEDVVAFEQFIAWICNEKLTVESSLGLAMTYILADKFLMEALKNAVVEKAKLVFCKAMISADGLVELCRNGLSQSLLGRYFWAQLAFEMIDGGFGWYVTDADRTGALANLLQVPENLVIFMAALDKAQNEDGDGELADPSGVVGCLAFLNHEYVDSEDGDGESGDGCIG